MSGAAGRRRTWCGSARRFGYDAHAGAARRRPRHPADRLHRHRRSVRFGQDDAAARCSWAPRPRSAGRSHRRPGAARRLRAAAGDGNWNFPVTVVECVLMARTGRGCLPWRTRAERPPWSEVLDRLGIAELGEPAHPGAVRRPAAADVHRPRAAARARSCCCWTSRPRGWTSPPGTTCCTCSASSTPTGVAIMLTTHDLNGMAAHLPHLVALQPDGDRGRARPREVINAPVLEQTFGAPMEVLRAPRHAGRRRPPTTATTARAA